MEILQLFMSSLGSDPRPTRFYLELKKFGNVTVCSAPPAKNFQEKINFIPLEKQKNNLFGKLKKSCNLIFRRYEKEIWAPHIQEILLKLQNRTFSLIVCSDIGVIPLAIALKELPQNKHSCKIVMDAREYYPRQYEDDLVWRIFFKGIDVYICRKYLTQVDKVYTVSPGLVQGYKKEYGINCDLLPSLSYYHDIKPHSTSGPLSCIHHGGAAPRRKLELMIEAFEKLEGKATLDLMLIPSDEAYLEKLKLLAKDLPHINIIPPVPMPEIVPYISQYDLGIYLLIPDSFNHKYALPNKFFEYIQARLGVIVSPVPDMANLVRERGVGLVTSDYTAESLTSVMSSITAEQVDAFKQKSDEASNELCWERNAKILQSYFSLA